MQSHSRNQKPRIQKLSLGPPVKPPSPSPSVPLSSPPLPSINLKPRIHESSKTIKKSMQSHSRNQKTTNTETVPRFPCPALPSPSPSPQQPPTPRFPFASSPPPLFFFSPQQSASPLPLGSLSSAAPSPAFFCSPHQNRHRLERQKRETYLSLGEPQKNVGGRRRAQRSCAAWRRRTKGETETLRERSKMEEAEECSAAWRRRTKGETETLRERSKMEEEEERNGGRRRTKGERSRRRNFSFRGRLVRVKFFDY